MRAMFDPQMALLSKHLESLVSALASEDGAAAAWEDARQAIAPTRASEPELAAIVDAQDANALKLLVAQWTGGQRPLPVQDREVLKRAMTAFRKSLKVTRLHDESGLTPNAMTSGRHSTIQGIMPPPRYPPEVWQELARQRRLIAAKHGIYELPPE
jgi:hypothetical protein